MSDIATSNVVELSNDNRLKVYNSTLEKLGKESAGSDLAKPFMALTVIKAAADNLITPDDAEAGYRTYMKGRQSVMTGKKAMGLGAGDNLGTDNSIKANASKNRQLIVAAQLPDIDFHDVCTRAVELRKNLLLEEEGVKVKPTFDVFVDCARTQQELAEEGELTDEQIKDEIRKAGSKTKTDLDKILAVYKATRKLAEELDNIPEIMAAAGELAAAITGLGEKIPAVTDEEKETEKLEKKAASLGFKLDRFSNI